MRGIMVYQDLSQFMAVLKVGDEHYMVDLDKLVCIGREGDHLIYEVREPDTQEVI